MIFRTPNWEDFVHTAFTTKYATVLRKICRCSATAGNDREPYSDIAGAPYAVLQRELSLLDRDIEKYFVFPDDFALARVGNPQGLGGASGMKSTITLRQTTDDTCQRGGNR